MSQANTKFSLDGYAYYIAGERRAKKPDMLVLPTLYERAITEADRRRWEGEAGAEEGLRTFWLGYLDLMVSMTRAQCLLLNDSRCSEER